MAADFKTISGANLFCDEDPGESLHIQLAEVALPELTRQTQSHMPGGGFMAMNVDMNMYDPLTLPFKLAGFNEDMLKRVGYNDGQAHAYTIFKEIIDARARTKTRLTCVVEGMLASYSQDSFSKGTLVGFNYVIDSIQSYRLELGEQVIFDFDLFANRRVTPRGDENAETNNILGVS